MQTLKQYLRYNSPQCAAFLNKNPVIKESVYTKFDKIQSSVFKDRIEIDILIWSHQVTVVPQLTYSLSNINKANAYKSIYCNLINTLAEGHPVEECDLSSL